MNFWFAHKSRPAIYGEEMLFLAMANHMNRHCGINIGLIASQEDCDLLKNNACYFDRFIEAELSGHNGATIKLDAINRWLPEGDALVDGDVFFSYSPKIDLSIAWALNYEPLYLFKEYPQEALRECLPKNKHTINAGFLYIPPPYFRQYAAEALTIAQKINCVGHTYEQMFFVKFCEDKQVTFSAIYPFTVHEAKDVETMWQKSGIRHPFCYKCSLIETQRCIQIAMKFGNAQEIKNLISEKWPYYKSMTKA